MIALYPLPTPNTTGRYSNDADSSRALNALAAPTRYALAEFAGLAVGTLDYADPRGCNIGGTLLHVERAGVYAGTFGLYALGFDALDDETPAWGVEAYDEATGEVACATLDPARAGADLFGCLITCFEQVGWIKVRQ